MSPTRSPLAWGPGSSREESRGGEGWTGAESGSRLDSWSVRPAAGAADGGVRGTEGASGVRLEACHERSFARVSHSSGNCALQY